jgi:hypothetical protein
MLRAPTRARFRLAACNDARDARGGHWFRNSRRVGVQAKRELELPALGEPRDLLSDEFAIAQWVFQFSFPIGIANLPF